MDTRYCQGPGCETSDPEAVGPRLATHMVWTVNRSQYADSCEEHVPYWRKRLGGPALLSEYGQRTLKPEARYVGGDDVLWM